MGRALESGLQRRWTELSRGERIQQMGLSECNKCAEDGDGAADLGKRGSLGSSYKIQGVGDEIKCSHLAVQCSKYSATPGPTARSRAAD